jgi:hypothetical protein
MKNIDEAKFDSRRQKSSMRTLTLEELTLVSGGDDGGSCSAAGDCGDVSGNGDTAGTLGTVTVTDSAAIGTAVGGAGGLAAVLTGSAGALGVGDAIAVGGVLGGAIGIASALFAAAIAAAIAAIPTNTNIPALGNPMGDPSPGGP